MHNLGVQSCWYSACGGVMAPDGSIGVQCNLSILISGHESLELFVFITVTLIPPCAASPHVGFANL
jgi:hypothetical protein